MKNTLENEHNDDALTPGSEGGPVKSFLEHLEDLRWVFIKSLSALGASMLICLLSAPTLIDLLKRPVIDAGLNIDLNPFGPMGGMLIWMKIAFYGGLILALPILLYFAGVYVTPALKLHEKKCFLGAFVIGGVLFLAGVFLCYFATLELALAGIGQINRWLGFTTDFWRAEEYFSFAVTFMVGTGLSFEVPVVLLTLVRLGIMPYEWLVKGRKYFFLANFALCAVVTPDATSTFFMVIPVQLLIEICILISRRWERQILAGKTKNHGSWLLILGIFIGEAIEALTVRAQARASVTKFG